MLTACFCAPCVSCRLAREVKNRAEMGQEPVDWRHLAAAPPGAYSAPAAPVMDAAAAGTTESRARADEEGGARRGVR